MDGIGLDLYAALDRMGHGELLADLTKGLAARDGTARQAGWDCEDGWYVVYTTTRVRGGPHDGKFVAQLFKPNKARTQWREVKRVQRSKRNLAKAQALRWYRAHSPKWAARHPA